MLRQKAQVRQKKQDFIQAAHKPRAFEMRFQPETLEAVASVDGSIVITVYAPEPSWEVSQRRRD